MEKDKWEAEDEKIQFVANYKKSLGNLSDRLDSLKTNIANRTFSITTLKDSEQLIARILFIKQHKSTPLRTKRKGNINNNPSKNARQLK